MKDGDKNSGKEFNLDDADAELAERFKMFVLQEKHLEADLENLMSRYSSEYRMSKAQVAGIMISQALKVINRPELIDMDEDDDYE